MTSPDRSADPRFSGVSVAEFFDHAERQVKTGRFSDGTEIKPEVRDAIGQFTKALAAQRAKWRYYIFVWSRHFFIIIDF